MSVVAHVHWQSLTSHLSVCDFGHVCYEWTYFSAALDLSVTSKVK